MILHHCTDVDECIIVHLLYTLLDMRVDRNYSMGVEEVILLQFLPDHLHVLKVVKVHHYSCTVRATDVCSVRLNLESRDGSLLLFEHIYLPLTTWT